MKKTIRNWKDKLVFVPFIFALFLFFAGNIYINIKISSNKGLEKNLNKEITSLRADIAKLESKYFDSKNEISKDLAKNLGLSSTNITPKYLTRGLANKVSLANEK